MTITQIKPSRGFSLLELVIAIAIFAFGSFAMGAMLIDSNVSTNISIERTEALFYAKEGLEAVRSIRDNDWNTISALTDGNHGISISSSTWNFSGVADTLNTKFTRTVYVTASSTASFVKNVAVTVDWPLLSGKLATTTLNTLVTNWINVRNLPSQIPTGGLVSYWSFDDALAGTAVDSVGTNTGTVSGATSTPGVRSYGYSFDGNANKITGGSITIGGPMSISAWIKKNTSTSQKSFFSNRGGGSLYLGLNATKVFLYNNGATPTSVLSDVGAVTIGQWQHIVATSDASTTIFYVNGISVKSSPQVRNSSTGTFGIGWDPSIQTEFWNGLIDQVRVYSRVLTPYEVGVIYSEEKP